MRQGPYRRGCQIRALMARSRVLNLVTIRLLRGVGLASPRYLTDTNTVLGLQSSRRHYSSCQGSKASGPGASCLEQRVQLVERAAALGADKERDGQSVWPVNDQNRRQRLPRAGVAQLTAGRGRVGQRALGNELGQSWIVDRRQAPANLRHALAALSRLTLARLTRERRNAARPTSPRVLPRAGGGPSRAHCRARRRPSHARCRARPRTSSAGRRERPTAPARDR